MAGGWKREQSLVKIVRIYDNGFNHARVHYEHNILKQLNGQNLSFVGGERRGSAEWKGETLLLFLYVVHVFCLRNSRRQLRSLRPSSGGGRLRKPVFLTQRVIHDEAEELLILTS